MANLKISEMTPAVGVTGVELLPLVQSGVNVSASVDMLKGYINANSLSGNYLVAGGGVSYTGTGYDYAVAAATYVIQGVQYSSVPATVTLSPGDSNDDRIDIIAVDDTGAVVAIEGTPSANPEAPDVDPETQLQLTFVYVAAGTSSADVTIEDIYLENTEWTYSDNSATLDPNSTAQTHGGTKSIEGTAVATGNFFTLIKPAGTFELNDYDSISIWVKSKASWPTTRNFRIFWFNGSTQVGTHVVIKNGTYGFDSTNTTDWQVLVIPVTDFAITPGQLVDRVRFRCYGTGTTLGFYFDDIFLQAGINPGEAGSFMKYRGDYSGIASYSPQEVVRDGGMLYVCVIANSASAPTSDESNVNWKLIGIALRTDIDGTLAANSDTRIATQKATKTFATAQAVAAVATAEAYTDAAVVGLWDDRGAFSAAGGAYPSSGGSGAAGAIKKGDIWTISVAGTLPTGQVVEVGDTVRALIDTPGNTQANWSILQNNIGYVPLNAASNLSDIGNAATAGANVVPQATHAATSKSTPVDNDEIPVADSAASYVLNKLTWANIKATLKTYFDTLYTTGSYASAAEYRVGTTTTKVLSPGNVWSAADYVALTDAATVAVDFSTALNFTLTIGGNRTLGAPSNGKPGQTGVIQITQDGTGNRTLGFNAVWKFAGGSDPILSTVAGTIDLLFYEVLPGGSNVFGNLVAGIA